MTLKCKFHRQTKWKELAKHGHDVATALLKQYQREIAADWIAAYHKYVSKTP